MGHLIVIQIESRETKDATARADRLVENGPRMNSRL